MSEPSLDPEPIQELLAIMARLRNREHGCPWDVEQDFSTIAPHTIEEAYEVADAIQRQDMADLKDELGDLLFQVVFHARMAEESGHFVFNDVVNSISNKMIERHPHVFGETSIETAAAQTSAWEAQKAHERELKAAQEGREPGALDGVIAAGLPALVRTHKLHKRAARVGFDWPGPAPVVDKIREELAEVEAEMKAGSGADRLEGEIGDLLCSCATLARHLGIDPDAALRRNNWKFETRFRRMETLARRQGRTLNAMTLAEMDELWDLVKSEEPKG